jgi:UPF0271 protein
VHTVDLNADVGEWDADAGLGQDPVLMPYITSANVACGVHAGSPAVMAATVTLARRHGVAVGAHPSLDDRDHFGRREIPIAPAAAATLVQRQVSALAAIARQQGVALTHVKPHGALYNLAARDLALANAIAQAVASLDAGLALFGLSGSQLIAAGQRAGLRTVSEVFADRGYTSDGTLARRGTPGAVIDDVDAVAARAVRMVLEQSVDAVEGTRVPLVAETICLHSDTPGSGELARCVRAALEAAGIVVSAFR